MTLEKDLERRFVAAAKGAGYDAEKLVAAGKRGWPDRTVLMPGGKVLFFELKTPKGKTSKQQDSTHDRLRSLGFDVFVVDSLAEALSVLRAHA